MSFFNFVNSLDLPKKFSSEIRDVVRDCIHVHGYDQGPVKVRVAEEFQEVGVRITGEFVTFALKQEDMETFKF